MFSNCVGVCSARLNLMCDTLLQHIYSLEDEVMRRVDVYFGSEFFKLRLEVIRVYMDSPYFFSHVPNTYFEYRCMRRF